MAVPGQLLVVDREQDHTNSFQWYRACTSATYMTLQAGATTKRNSEGVNVLATNF
jgi:hypothetical protein